jgi:hypothetical protein
MKLIPPSPQDKCCSTFGGAAFFFGDRQARLNERKIKMPASAAAAFGLTIPPSGINEFNPNLLHKVRKLGHIELLEQLDYKVKWSVITPTTGKMIVW